MILPNVHDAKLVSFSSMQLSGNIIFGVQLPGESHFRTVLFEDVLAYRLENDLFGCILFGIELIDPVDCIRENDDYLQKYKKHGWPKGWESRRETIDDFIRKLEVIGVNVESSYGLCGWIICRRVVMVDNNDTQ